MVAIEHVEVDLIQRLRNAEWKEYRFDQIAENINDRVDDPSEAGVDYYVGLEHLDPESLKIRRWGAPTDGAATKLRFKPGDIIFGRRRAYQRKLAVAEFEGICSAHTMVLRAREDVVLPEFLPFFLQSDTFFDRAIAISVGSLSPTINWKALAAQKFLLPPKQEQRQISVLLQAVDDATEAFHQVAREIKAYSDSIWAGVQRDQSWPTTRLGDVAGIRSGTTPNRGNKRFWQGGTVPWLTTERVHDRIITRADQYVTSAALMETSLWMVPTGSTLVAMYGQGKTRGSVALLHTEATINQAFAAVIPSECIDPLYLFSFLDSAYQQLRSLSQGSNQENLSVSLLKAFPVPLPPLAVQRRLGTSMAEAHDMASAAQAHMEKLMGVRRLLIEVLLSSEG